MTEATLTLPFLPPSETSPNFHGHWRKQRSAVLKLKEDTYMVAKSLGIPQFTDKVLISITYVFKAKRIRDGDNYTAMFKGML